MTSIFVLDTSYLLELYSVPGFSDPMLSKRLRERIAREENGRFHVPAGCLYKLCDHIADVPDGNRRHQLARRIATDVESSVSRAVPWLISPSQGLGEFAGFVRAFASDPSRLKIGLTNSDVVEIATALKGKYGASAHYRVHIWTRNRSLKAYEPDAEPNPF